MIMTMTHFHLNCGDFLNHVVTEEGIFPKKVIRVTFYYTNGRAHFDGREWTYHLIK